MQQTKQYELNQPVFVHTIKKDGVIESINHDKGTVIVNVSKNPDKKNRVEVDFNNISPYKPRKPKKYNPNEMYWMVRDFHKAFNHPASDKPTPLPLETAINRAVWTGEEVLVEFIHQSCENEEQFLQAYDRIIAGLEKAKEKSLSMEYPKNDIERIVGQSDALVDGMYFINGSFVISGVKPFNLFKIVQEANMGKLHNGIPKYRESDGKIIKPENWERDYAPEPKLKEEIKRQSR